METQENNHDGESPPPHQVSLCACIRVCVCVYACIRVCACVSNLSITIYTCKGQINTPDTKNPENPKQQRRYQTISEALKESSFYRFNSFLISPGTGLAQTSLVQVPGTPLLLNKSFISVFKKNKRERGKHNNDDKVKDFILGNENQ